MARLCSPLAAVAVTGVLALALSLIGIPTAAAGPVVGYQPPVDAPIVDHFRPPACLWCAGNRGIDYAVASGTAVRASAAGTVTFAGAIGAERFVTVLHGDGLRTTYAFLATIAVHVGQPVARGAVVGTAGVALHFGVRRGTVYLDPELLLGGGRLVARLVPISGARPRGAAGAPARAPPLSPLAPGKGPFDSATMTRWPVTGGPRHHEHAATCGRPLGRGRARHQNRRKETRTSWRRSSPCVSCSRRGCTSVTRPAGGTRR
jgi:hypothetical protein